MEKSYRNENHFNQVKTTYGLLHQLFCRYHQEEETLSGNTESVRVHVGTSP